MDEETRDDLTEAEEATVEDTGVSGEEAHRIGEFRDLRDRIESVAERQDEILDRIDRVARALAAQAVVSDDGEAAPEQDVEDYVDPRERDYSL